MTNWLLDNTYFTFADKIYKQQIGIPMGTSCAPFLANFFLFYYEYTYILNNMRDNYFNCKKLLYTFRFIDDITTLNDNGFFENNYKDIYPSSLILEKVNNNSKHANVLDLDIKIKNDNTADIMLFDKREDFNFVTINFPYYDSNISHKMCIQVLINEINRYIKINTKISSSSECIKKLLTKLNLRGYDVNFIKNTIASKFPMLNLNPITWM